LQLLESQFPFGKYAEQGQLELITPTISPVIMNQASLHRIDLSACILSILMWIMLFM
jgi:hypothetical protein